MYRQSQHSSIEYEIGNDGENTETERARKCEQRKEKRKRERQKTHRPQQKR